MNTTKKTPGQIAYEASKTFVLAWDDTPSNLKEAFEASALAVLASQWRPVTEPPEDERDRVFVTTNGNHSGCTWFYNRDSVRTHWMPIPPLPPTKQELERKEFEEWAFNAGYGCSATITRDTIFIGWQAARATAKPNP